MKKLMKAIAFATVMCMLLSTAAFAAGTAELTETNYVVDVTVTTENDAEQVALLIVDSAVTDIANVKNTQIAYVNQDATAATAETGVYAAKFSVTISDAFDEVDVYAGYASNTGSILVEDDLKLTNEPTELVISIADGADAITIYDDVSTLGDAYKGEAHVGAAAALNLDFQIPTGYTAKKVIWALRVGTGESRTTYYTTAADVTGFESMEGSVKLGVSFINGTVGASESVQDITDVDAIFLFEKTVEGQKVEEDVFTDTEGIDVANKNK